MFNVGFSEQHHTLRKSLMHNAAILKGALQNTYTVLVQCSDLVKCKKLGFPVVRKVLPF